VKKDIKDILIQGVRYNKNITNNPTKIEKSTLNIDKKEYSTISLVSFMYETGFIDMNNINESFSVAKEYIAKYEEK
jgi:hypothetical protein